MHRMKEQENVQPSPVDPALLRRMESYVQDAVRRREVKNAARKAKRSALTKTQNNATNPEKRSARPVAARNKNVKYIWRRCQE